MTLLPHLKRPHRSAADERLTMGAATMPSAAERTLPWIGAALLAAICNLAVSVLRLPLSSAEWAALTIVLAGTLAAAGLLAARATQEAKQIARDERARPAIDELMGMEAMDPLGAEGAPAYLTCMQGWTDALIDLLDHATAATGDDAVAEELAEAAEDTRALRDLLRSSIARGLNLNEAAMLHTVVTLWESDQGRLEAMAAATDPSWHRRWRARTVIDRQLRHGLPGDDHLVLPYRS